MTTEEALAVEQLYDESQDGFFSCASCRVFTGDHDCWGCPVYAQSFSDD